MRCALNLLGWICWSGVRFLQELYPIMLGCSVNKAHCLFFPLPSLTECWQAGHSMFSVVTLRFGLFILVQMFSVTKYSIGKYYQHITAVPGISMQTPATQPQDRPHIVCISFSRRKYQEKQQIPQQQPKEKKKKWPWGKFTDLPKTSPYLTKTLNIRHLVSDVTAAKANHYASVLPLFHTSSLSAIVSDAGTA